MGGAVRPARQRPDPARPAPSFPDPKGFTESAAQELWFLRRYSAKLLYELELYLADDIESMRSRYVEILGGALRVEPSSPTDWLFDVDPGFYCTEYLRSWAFEAQMRFHLCSKYGYDCSKKQAGSLLQELWSPARSRRPTRCSPTSPARASRWPRSSAPARCWRSTALGVLQAGQLGARALHRGDRNGVRSARARDRPATAKALGDAPRACWSRSGELLALVGLILAFGLTMAVGRHDSRRAAVVDETNAIGTTYLRAQTLAEPMRARSLDLLERYTDTSITLSNEVPTTRAFRRTIAEGGEIQRLLWRQAGDALAAARRRARPASTSRR